MSLTEALDHFHAAAAATTYGPADDADLELAALAASHALVVQAEQMQQAGVVLSRRAGATWTDIGKALGVSKQAAQQRYGTAG